MITIGIDPSLSAFGWAVHDSNATGRSRRIASGHEETLPTTVLVARYTHFRSLVEKLIREYSPNAIGIESPAFDAGPFMPIHYCLMVYALEAIFNSRLDCVLFDPATLKSLARGDKTVKSGPMTKLDMQRFVQLDTMDSNVIDNNEADAYCIALFANKFLRVINGDIDPSTLSKNEFNTFLGRKKTVNTLKGKKVKRVAHAFRENSRYFQFSKVPLGRVDLPKKSEINSDLMKFLEELESD
jgi:Holliday junction resolvasome RuvABC endonuclease subunit